MKNKLNLFDQIRLLTAQNQDGKLEGGFQLIGVLNNHNIIAGLTGDENTNNCGGNCVQGCANNAVPGCGGTINTSYGCGKTM